MARPVWKGTIAFGLVNVPVALYAAEQRTDLKFNLIDSRNAARVRYERVNEETGREVPWDKIVKGYEYGEGNYVLLSKKELETASVEMVRSIDVDTFVPLEEIDSVYFDRPYYLVPEKGMEKGYALLREAMLETGRVGIATIVIRARQHLAAVIPEGDALVLNLLRFQQELRNAEDFELPGADLKKLKVSRQEVDLAKQLVEGLAGEWNPEQYHDEYRDALMTLVEKKIASGETEAIEEPEAPEPGKEPETINFMDVLRRSVEAAEKESRKSKKPPQKKRRRRSAG
jgi:DNA end-binding protein Ku